ncbi:transcription intermediary factor 1-alpha-like isoform X2 [Genypterus blacodes]|uniref:transcription intermediary factor 1-alpha-like isoform X2 n=1 Tax=Genypterus blacodes TaxID=154954 RepID=UPI003F759D12
MEADGQQESKDVAAALVVENEAESTQEEKWTAAASLNYMETCPVCRLNFHSREPKLLPCLHSFCKKCLPSPSRNLATTELPNFPVDSATKPLNVIRCPVCRQECMEVDVMENVFVKDSVEAPSSTVERTLQLCMTCDDNTEASGFCTDCVEYLCATCVEAHQRVKFTKDHNIRQTTDISQEGGSVSTQRPMFCDVHKQEPLKLFCETCDLLTCRDCQLVKHKDHNYQFLEDACKNHKQHMESMTHQLQEKKKVIEDVSHSINNGLLKADENRTSVHNEIKKSICNLILEINKKGKMLVNQLEAVTKDHEGVLRKQQEDIGFLSRHLDHVINFITWATARNGGAALLYCKRLILFQIGNLLRAKCSTAFIQQSSVRFQCRSSYWASNVDLGSLVVESVPGSQPGGIQGISHQVSHPVQGPSSSPSGLVLPAPHSTLAQLQMQVDKLNLQARWQPQPAPPPWTRYQSVHLQRTVPRPLQGGSPSHIVPQQPISRFVAPPPNNASPTSSLPTSGFTPQLLRGMGGNSSYQPKATDLFSPSPFYTLNSSLPIDGDVGSPHSRQAVNNSKHKGTDFHTSQAEEQQNPPRYSAVSQEEKPGTVSWKPPEAPQANSALGSAVKKRPRSSPEPIIVIKDEPEDDSSYLEANQRVSLPDSTGDQHQTSVQGGWDQDPQSTEDKLESHVSPPRCPQDQCEANPPSHTASLKDPGEVLCAVCQNGGELLWCDRCPKVFHPTCHVPSLFKSSSGQWFCSFCRDLLAPEMEYDCVSKPEAKTVKEEPDSEGGFPPVDKRRCERLLLHLFCSESSSACEEPRPPAVLAANRKTTPITLNTVKTRLEAPQSLSYQTPAEFVSDVRLIFRDCVVLSEDDAKAHMTGRTLKELFEEHLKIIYPDQTFSQIKTEQKPVTPLVCQPSAFNDALQPAKRRRTCSNSQSAP